MKILSVRHIDGPNIYIYKPVMVARIDLGPLSERESFEFPGFSDRLLRTFPGLREHHCAKGAPGGFVERLYGGTYFGHIVEHLAIELACCAGIDVHFGKTLYATGAGQYDIIMECKAYECQRYLLGVAVDMVTRILNGQAVSVEESLTNAQKILAEHELGPSTRAVVEAAQRRGIPVRRLNEGSLVQLGYGKKRKLVEATVNEDTSVVAVDIASDKSMTNRLLRDAGIPVPEGAIARSLEEALEVFRDLDGPVVVKPYDGNQGRGVSLHLMTDDEVENAYHIASQYASKVLVERHIQGHNIRVLVVEGQFKAACERVPARVFADGQHSIRELIEMANQDPLRGDDHEKPLTKIIVDDIALRVLRKQGLSLEDIPTFGQVVWLRDSANLSTGGEAVDITDRLHPVYRSLAERASRLIGLNVAGIDMVVGSVESPPSTPADCCIIEVNAAPGIRMHEFPSIGTPRNVGDDIVAALFPLPENGRIPIVSVTGTNGKTTTTRLIGHGIRTTGKCVGMTTTGGVFINETKIVDGDTTGPQSARMVLADPLVEVAVLETARGGICRGGLAYDRADVAVLTNITLDHLGQDGVDSIEDLLHVKSLVAECVREDGWVVLNAGDEHLVGLSKRLHSKIAFFSTTDGNTALMRHLACGGVGYYLANGWLVEARGSLTWDIVPVHEIPLTQDGTAEFQIENCLAAAGALRAMGLSRGQVAQSLTSFKPSVQNPGRCMTYQMPNGGHVILDYGHNPDGFVKMGSWLRRLPHKRLIGVVGVPGDRVNHVVRESAERVADIFDCLIVKEDEDKRGRMVGEVASLMAEQIRASASDKPCMIVLSEAEALKQAICGMDPQDVVVAFYEKFSRVEEVVLSLGATPVDRIQVMEFQTAMMMTTV